MEPFSSTIVVPSLNATDLRALRSGNGSYGRRVISDIFKCGELKFTSPAMIAVLGDVLTDSMLRENMLKNLCCEELGGFGGVD